MGGRTLRLHFKKAHKAFLYARPRHSNLEGPSVEVTEHILTTPNEEKYLQ